MLPRFAGPALLWVVILVSSMVTILAVVHILRDALLMIVGALAAV